MYDGTTSELFVVYDGTTSEFETYMAEINLLYDTIKFTHEASFEEVSFLDTTVYKGPRFNSTGILDIKTHVKPTNKQLYVHADSYHPTGCKTGIVTGEALRYLRTNSQEETFKEWMSKHKLNLRARGYKPSKFNEILSSITHDKRVSSLESKSKQASGSDLTFVNTYNDETPDVRKIIYDNWSHLHTDPVLKELFPKPPIMALKRNKTLANSLVKSKPDPWVPVVANTTTSTVDMGRIHRSMESTCHITKCVKRTCILCPILSTDCSITSKVSRRKHRIYGEFACSTPRLVYLLECTRCGKQYVGQTVQPFSQRVAKHLLHIRQGGRDKLPLHFNSDGHSVKDIIFHPIASIGVRIPIKDAEQQLKDLETIWIKRLACLQPLGLNFLLVDKQSRVIG